MPNPYRFKHNVETIRKQLKDGVNKIHDNLEENKDMDFGGIISSIVSGIKEAIDGIGEPSFQKRYAKRIPNVEDYNKNIREICNDIDSSYIEIENLTNDIKNNFNYNAISNNKLEKEVFELKNQVDKISLYNNEAEVKNDSGTFVITEDFKTSNNIDKSLTTADIDNHSGVVSLNKDRSINLIDSGTKVEIVGDSEGFVGNLHQVKTDGVRDIEYSRNEREKKIVWYGEENPRLNKYDILDDNPNTWFEYELVNVSNAAKKKAKGYGFSYKVSDNKEVSWARNPKNGRLSLTLKITLDKAQRINWIDVNPYVPEFKGAKGAIIKSIKTSKRINETPKSIYSNEFINYRLNENTETYDRFLDEDLIPGNDDFTGRGVFTFSPRTAKHIYITFEQNSPYSCIIGHNYVLRITRIKIKEDGGWFHSDDTTYETRKYRIPTELNKYDKKLIEGNDDNWLEGAFKSIFGGSVEKTIVSDKTENRVEAFDGKRWAIGIRDINVNAYGYSEESQIVSRNYIIPGRIKRVLISANEHLPKVFYSGQNSETSIKNKNNWIKYFVSFDDGKEWHEIGNGKDGIANEIYLNSKIPDEMQNENVKYIKSDSDNNFKFKAVFKRPVTIEDAEFFTPILKNFKADMLIDLSGDDY